MKRAIIILFSIILYVHCKKDDDRSKPCFEYSPLIDLKIGDTVSFSNCSLNSTHYLWHFGDGDTSTIPEPKHTYNDRGSYKVKLLAFNDKSSDSIISEIMINSKPDDILYDTLSPNIELHSIRSRSGNQDCYIPIPNDSVSTFALDITGDSVDDFTFIVKHHPTGNQCGRCSYGFVYEIIVQGNSICVQKNDQMLGYYLNYSQIISDNLSWSSSAELSINGCMIPYNAHIQNKYIGVKINNNFGWIRVEYGYNNGIIIKEYGFNRTEAYPIKAGQRF